MTLKLTDLFPSLNDFVHAHLFENIEQPWEPLKTLSTALQVILSEPPDPANRQGPLPGMTFAYPPPEGDHPDPGIYITQWMKLDEPIILPRLGIYIGAGTKLEPSAIIKGPCVIGRNCDVRQGAYLRGNVLVGNHCTLGHATEIKNSILMNHTEAGHFNYVGDSILGSHVNLGAGTRLANLQFRTEEEKTQGFIHTVRLPQEGGDLDTGMEKLGAVIGDFCELGCNVVVSPGVVIGANTWVYPNSTIPKGYYEPRQVLVPRELKPRTKKR